MSKKKTILIGLGAILVAIQFVPLNRTNPPVQGDITAPADIKKILRRSCYDCHSNETRWPLYSYAAPLSFWIVDHVNEGREKLNFSTWEQMSSKDRSEAMEEIGEEVEEGKMPLPSYLPLHPSAALSVEDRRLLQDWVRSRARPERQDHD